MYVRLSLGITFALYVFVKPPLLFDLAAMTPSNGHDRQREVCTLVNNAFIFPNVSVHRLLFDTQKLTRDPSLALQRVSSVARRQQWRQQLRDRFALWPIALPMLTWRMVAIFIQLFIRIVELG